MSNRIAVVGILGVCAVMLSGCPGVQAPVGVWSYYEHDGTLVATVTFSADGEMHYGSPAGNGNGTWSENAGRLMFSVSIDSSPVAQLVFDGTIVRPDVIVGVTTSDQPPTMRSVYMVP